jgi:hypothetical protein
MTKKTKKCILVLAEGISDQNALYKTLDSLVNPNSVRFKVVNGDVLSDNLCNKPIKSEIGDMINAYLQKVHLKKSDILFVTQITDTDGVFIDNNMLVIDPTIDSKLYREDSILVKDISKKEQMISRNTRKANNLRFLCSTTLINKMQYSIYYFSCNLDHCIHDDPNVPQEMKSHLANLFSLNNTAEKVIALMQSTDIATLGNYSETWSYIQRGDNSLRRGSNFHILLNYLIDQFGE